MFATRQTTIPAPYRPPTGASRSATGVNGAWLPLIERMRTLRESRPEPVALAFASIEAGGGTTYITHRLSADLRQCTGQRVATCSALELWESSTPGLVPIEEEHDTDPCPGNAPGSRDAIDLLQQHFDYLIVDCPPLSRAPDAMMLAKRIDGLCLIIEAGRTTKSELQSHLSTISLSGVRIFGLVFNKRRNPVPDFIYRML